MTDVVDGGPAALVDLETAKQHLRVDHVDDDVLIAGYIAAAEAMVLGYLKCEDFPSGGRAQAACKVAVLLMVGDLYAGREASQEGAQSPPAQITATARMLIDPYRILSI